MFMLAGLLLLARGLEAERATGSLAAALLVLTAGYSGQGTRGDRAGTHCRVRRLAVARRWRARAAIVTRTIVLTGLDPAALGGYILIRARLFGSAFGAYSALGISPDLTGAFRAFLIRTFLPPGRVVEYLWMHHYDLVLVIAGAVTRGLSGRSIRSRSPGPRLLERGAADLARTLGAPRASR